MILDKFKLDGKVGIVTGCATGLGQAMALGLAEAGADIAGVYNTHTPEVLKQKVEQMGRRFIAIQANLITIDSISMIVEKTISEFGHLDILINNAGIIRRSPSVEYTEKDWDDTMNVNLKSVFFLCQAAARQFIKQGAGGKIVNIASLLSFQGGILIPPYTASKSGVSGITKLLANEWAKHNITVNAIAPGYIETDATEALMKDPVRYKDILNRIPAGRWGKPEDLQGIAVFLASESSNYLNGFTIAVDGGWLGR